MTRQQALELLAALPGISDDTGGLEASERARLVAIRLRLGGEPGSTVTDHEATWLRKIADRLYRKVTGYDEA